MQQSTVVVINGEISEELQRKLDELALEVAHEIGEENVEKIGFPKPPKK